MDFRIADTFTDSLARLTSKEQKAVKTTAFDLQLYPANPGMSFQVSEQRVVTFILLAMRIESSKRPSNLIACLNHGAVHIYRQTVQTQSLDLLVDQYTVQLR